MDSKSENSTAALPAEFGAKCEISSAKAIQLIEPIDHTFRLKIDVLEKILGSDEIRDRKIVAVSIAGALRQGKSFLLNFCLRYLNVMYKSKDVAQFLNEEDKNDEGFSWRCGSKPNTIGIWIWSEIFTHGYENGEKIAIILMDTQGAFDSESSMRDCSTIFALSTLLSSVQCYNLMRNIREDDLQHLHLFTEYGKLSLADSNEKPFQKLLFVVRDWPFAYENAYGSKGGQEIVSDRLSKTGKQTKDMENLRDQLLLSFAEIEGFLMPYPGDAVARSQNYDGNLKEISPEFIEMVKELMPKLLSPENLIIKQINGQKIRSTDWIQYLKSYMKVFSSNDIPEPKSLLDATADSYYLIALHGAKSKYMKLMMTEIKAKPSYLMEDEFKSLHADVKSTCINEFKSKPKLGGSTYVEKYLKLLEDGIEEEANNQKTLNENKKEEFIKVAKASALVSLRNAIHEYKASFEKELTSSPLSEDKMNSIHLKIKANEIKMFKANNKIERFKFLEKVYEQLQSDLEKEFLQFKLKNSEKEIASLKEAKNENIMLNRYLQTQQQPAPQAYFSPPTPSYSYTPSYSDYSEPCSSYSNCSRPSYSYSPSVASGSSSSSTRTRVNYTQAENTKLANLYAKHGNDHARVTREFNSSSACQNTRSTKQIQSKYYRMKK